MGDEEKTICEDCQNDDHCNDEGDDYCDCDCTCEDEDGDKNVKTVDEIDECYTPDSSEDIADEHMTHNRSGFGRLITTMIIISGIVVGAVYIYDNGMIDLFLPLNGILQPDNPIVVEKQSNSDVNLVENFIDGCNLRLVKTGNVVTGGNLDCVIPPTIEQVEVAKKKFEEIYG